MGFGLVHLAERDFQPRERQMRDRRSLVDGKRVLKGMFGHDGPPQPCVDLAQGAVGEFGLGVEGDCLARIWQGLLETVVEGEGIRKCSEDDGFLLRDLRGSL